MSDQAETELRAFRHFVEVAGLPVEPTTIEKRPPPEPDVRCRLAGGGPLAFELVEICNPTNARFMFSSQRVFNLIMSAYQGLPPSVREAFDHRFIDRPLSFSFKPTASQILIRNVLPALLTELASASPSLADFSAFSPDVAAVVTKVRFNGRLNDPGQVNFNLGGSFDPSLPLDAVSAKLSKQYRCDCPIELLAHFGGLAWSDERSYVESFRELFRARGLGPFRRVWVMDGDGISISLPEVATTTPGAI